MNILGIETSCDETAASIVKDGRLIRSSVVSSSLGEHKKYGGIIPEIASRRQLEAINIVVRHASEEAQCGISRINAIAVTRAPGLIGSLLVGLSFARALSFTLHKPLIEVDHIQAHLYAPFLTNATDGEPPDHHPRLPTLGLIVSGGHTSLYLIKSWTDFKLLGKTRDDAAGEAFDKVARILNLGYPGGPVIDRMAQQASNHQLTFSCAEMPGTYDFSFSGIKTAVLYYQQKHKILDKKQKAHIAQAFQESVVSILIKKCLTACRDFGIPNLILGGGVAANSRLRQALAEAATPYGIKVFSPSFNLCMDNAAMVAGLAYHLLKR
ncbi:MAG: tRNA (adenosine(37)-N6)-threonylcarbamoyltransferase complex transferase subunit TsaD [Candidatus Omnitrophota bacterium]|jgi:N6-L-threonylcarbamoyladenine synthase